MELDKIIASSRSDVRDLRTFFAFPGGVEYIRGLHGLLRSAVGAEELLVYDSTKLSELRCSHYAGVHRI